MSNSTALTPAERRQLINAPIPRGILAAQQHNGIASAGSCYSWHAPTDPVVVSGHWTSAKRFRKTSTNWSGH